jgi:potassium voltage-gated channel Eag-related subfamily H protein 5
MISRFDIPYVEFVLLLRATRVSKIVQNIEDATSIRDKFAAPIDLAKLIYFLIFVSHMCACSWHYLAIVEVKILQKKNI